MRWEYYIYKYQPGGFFGGKVDSEEISDELNRLGADGWELASTFDTSTGQGVSKHVIMILKRPVQE